MPKLATKAKAAKKEVALDDVRKTIAGEIFRKYNMSVSEFSRSDKCKALDINGATLSSYLSGSSTSFKVLSKLWSALGLGELMQEQVRTTKYFAAEK